jgi:copper(I)-binding protein
MLRGFLHAALLAIAAGAVLMPAVSAHEYKIGSLEIKHPWSRATPKGAAVGGGYMTVINTGTTADRLTGGSVSVAGKFEIHEMTMTGGVMKMRPLPAGIEIKPGQTLEFKPGSFHLMFVQLKQPLIKGERVKGTLVFEKAGMVEVEYVVEAVGKSPEHQGH